MLDDLVGGIGLLDREPALADRIFGRLVEVLVERQFDALRERLDAGHLCRSEYVAEVALTIERCRAVGIPLRT